MKRITQVKIYQLLSDNIRQLAEKRKLGINALADTAGVSRSQLYDVLAGSKSPTVDFLDLVAIPLKVPVYKLLTE